MAGESAVTTQLAHFTTKQMVPLQALLSLVGRHCGVCLEQHPLPFFWQVFVSHFNHLTPQRPAEFYLSGKVGACPGWSNLWSLPLGHHDYGMVCDLVMPVRTFMAYIIPQDFPGAAGQSSCSYWVRKLPGCKPKSGHSQSLVRTAGPEDQSWHMERSREGAWKDT